ncbi:MAG: DNA primase [Clostridia bacterium]|nr:DNA primase [Clostridia bacterium]
MNERKGFVEPKFLEELRQKNEITEVISSYVALDKKGNTHWACCPFHHERTPSFAVNEADQFYHCFGCGVSGDVIKFVREIESTDFMGAVRILAARAKLEVPENNFDSEKAVQAKKKRDSLAAIMLDSARFYRANLYSGDSLADAHLEYISNRQMSPTTVKKFGIGASLDFFGLADYLQDKGYSRADLLDSGVLTESKSGKLIDSQGGRLIFPIINAFDEVVAFGGRLLEKRDFAKYKNTKETMLFNKSKTLYNINLLKKLKRTQPIKEVIIVEGYMDTISLYQAGFENVVASMGTSLTKDQARLVKRYSENILISYDGDFAGQKADLRGLEILKDEHLNVKVVPMPEGLDPDDVAKQGADAYQKCLDAAMPLIDYKIHALERKYDIKKSEEKRQFLSEALKVVKTAESETVKEELLKKLRDKTGITYQSLERDLSSVKKEQKQEMPTPKTTIVEAGQGSDKNVKAARFILAAKLFSATYAQSFDVKSVEFSVDVHRVIAEYIIEREGKGERIRPSELFEILDEDCAEFNEILDLNYGDKLSGEVAERFFADSVKALQREFLEKQIGALKAKIETETDEEKKKQLTVQLSESMLKKKKIR